jgi:hypothetical protein
VTGSAPRKATYERAWPLDESGTSVLVACGSIKDPYWWVLCPASATLYLGEVDEGCSDASCEFDDVHRMAVKTWERVGG